jgi:hypothetical protein
MIDIAILRAMAAAGAPVEAILAAIEADQRSEIARVQARRLADKERQRRKRHADSIGQAVTPPDTPDISLSLTSSLLTENIKENKKSKKERDPPARKTKLPDEWKPSETHYAKGDRAMVDQKADDMRNWAKSKGIMRVDWDATFHGFLRPRENSLFNGGGNGTYRNGGATGGREGGHRSWASFALAEARKASEKNG